MTPTYDVYAHVNGIDFQKCYMPFIVSWSEHYILHEIHITKDNHLYLILDTDFQVYWNDAYAIVIMLKPHKRCRLKFVNWFSEESSVYFDSVYDVHVCNTARQMFSQEALSCIDLLIKERNAAREMLVQYGALHRTVPDS